MLKQLILNIAALLQVKLNLDADCALIIIAHESEKMTEQCALIAGDDVKLSHGIAEAIKQDEHFQAVLYAGLMVHFKEYPEKLDQFIKDYTEIFING